MRCLFSLFPLFTLSLSWSWSCRMARLHHGLHVRPSGSFTAFRSKVPVCLFVSIRAKTISSNCPTSRRSLEASSTLTCSSLLRFCLFLPARRYASADRLTSFDPMSACLCPSVTNRSSSETAERIELVFGMRASFHLSTYIHTYVHTV